MPKKDLEDRARDAGAESHSSTNVDPKSAYSTLFGTGSRACIRIYYDSFRFSISVSMARHVAHRLSNCVVFFHKSDLFERAVAILVAMDEYMHKFKVEEALSSTMWMVRLLLVGRNLFQTV